MPHVTPVSLCFERGRRVAFMPPPVSFHFERGQHEYHTLPPFLFILNGGSVNPTRCPRFFSFTPRHWGVFSPVAEAACAFHAASVSVRLPPPLMGGFLPRGIDKQGQRETHTLPRFFSFNPPSLGGYFPLY